MAEDDDLEWWWSKIPQNQRGNIPKIRAGRFYNQMIAEGLIPLTPEWRKRSKYLTKSCPTPEQYARVAEMARKRRERNVEKARAKERKLKAKQRARRSEEINAQGRERYNANRAVESASQRERRYLREPHRKIRTNTDLYLAGLLTHEQYFKSVDECLERAEQIESDGLRKAGRPLKKA